MKQLDINEHTSCLYHQSDLRVKFRHTTIKKGDILKEDDATLNYMIFVLSGELIVSCDQCINKKIYKNEFFFFPKSSYHKGQVLSDTELVILSFDWITNLYDNISIMELEKIKTKIEPIFNPLPIKAPMQSFFIPLCVYLKDETDCIRLHEIKLSELLWILRTYYTKEELANLFHPIIGKSLKFRNKVLSIYQSAGTAQELAQMCGYTRQAFGKLFLQEFGETTYAWMQKNKLIQIKTRLADPSIQLQDIVSEFNLSSLPHLNRLCKNYFSKTPIEIRKDLTSI